MPDIILSALCSVWLKVFDVDKNHFLPPILKMRNLRQMVFPHLEICSACFQTQIIFLVAMFLFSQMPQGTLKQVREMPNESST